MEEDAETEARFEPASRRICDVEARTRRGGGGRLSRELYATLIM